jgi:von Willebrand factor type A domain
VDVSLLTPLGALLALVVVVPLVALRFVRRRADAVRTVLRVPPPSRRSQIVTVTALVASGVLLGLAAAQPRIEWTTTRELRTDAEAFVVIDTSRSMLARDDPKGTIRYHRARRDALRFRDALPEVPLGIASLTDRVLPHLFPSANDDVFAATLTRSIGVDRPPPQGTFISTATRLESLISIVQRRFFSPTATTRVVIVLTDGESVPASGARLAAAFGRPPGLKAVFVHYWASDEHVYAGGQVEPQYSPDPRARGILESVADAVGGEAFGEDDLGDAISAVREFAGEGELEPQGEKENRIALAPYLAGAVFLPLGLLLWRRDR